VQKPTQTLASVKGPGNTFPLCSKWARTLPPLIYCSWDIYRYHPFTKKNQISKLIFDTLLWAWSAETHPCTYVSYSAGQYRWLNLQVGKNFAVLNIFSWDIYRNPPPQKNSNIKIDIWHPVVGLRCRNLAWHLMLIKVPVNTFDLDPKWTRTLRSLIFFDGIFIETTPSQKRKNQISKLIFDTILWAWGAETHIGTYVC
jgi:hypothetical protein